MSESSKPAKGFEYWKAALLVCFGWRYLAIQMTTMRSRASSWPSIPMRLCRRPYYYWVGY